MGIVVMCCGENKSIYDELVALRYNVVHFIANQVQRGRGRSNWNLYVTLWTVLLNGSRRLSDVGFSYIQWAQITQRLMQLISPLCLRISLRWRQELSKWILSVTTLNLLRSVNEKSLLESTWIIIFHGAERCDKFDYRMYKHDHKGGWGEGEN